MFYNIYSFASEVVIMNGELTTYIWLYDRYKNGYEPYILISRRYMPWYDERFRGYGWDKVSASIFHPSLN